MRDPRLPPIEADAFDFMDSVSLYLAPLQKRGVTITLELTHEALEHAITEHAGTINHFKWTVRDDGTETWPLTITFADDSTLLSNFAEDGQLRVECHIPITAEEKEQLEQLKRDAEKKAGN